MWLVYHLTGSSFYTGIAGFLIKLPNSIRFLFGPLVDQWELRRLLVVSQVVQGLVALVVPIAAAMGKLSVWVVLVVMPLVSLLNQLVSPAEEAALPRIIQDEHLVRANSLMSFADRGTEVTFNAASGVLIAVIGATALFVVNSITFWVAAVLLLGVVIPASELEESESEDESESYLSKLRDGMSYLWGSLIVPISIGGTVGNFGVGAMFAVLPAFADSFSGAAAYGFLMAAISAGTLAGATGASLVDEYPYGVVISAGFVVAGLSLFAATVVPGLFGTAAFIFGAFLPIGVFNVMFFSLLQTSVDENFIGRVSSTASSLITVMLPVGNLFGGVIAEAFGPAAVLSLFAGLLFLSGVFYGVHPGIRSLPTITETDEATLILRE